MRSRLKEWVGRFALMFVSFAVAIIFAEIVTRIFYPISDGRANVTLDGEQITGFLEPGSVYRQVSNEYDALTTITPRGHRVPQATADPDLVIVGDSFTFGWGLDDSETFVHIFCENAGLACANLGEPATGTAKQLDNLERHLDRWGWRPREVKLFVFAMTASFSSGNDLRDNFNQRMRQARQSNDEAGQPPSQGNTGMLESVIRSQHLILQRSNLVRIAKYHWGPALRSGFVPELEEERLQAALEITRQELHRLPILAKHYGFTYTIYLIHPVQDIMRDTYTDTLRQLNEVSPAAIRDTAELFLENPEDYYYSYDGHLNADGSRKLAEFLIREHEGQEAD